MAPHSTSRDRPDVPNHELVRIIGRGAYGEIWLAQSATGTLRAVKIVRRTNFESKRAFEREFEGMAKFEPISREHDGFVDILHVGHDPNGQFFYYVMELADDVSGAPVDPGFYEPKTLKTELHRRSRLMADECISLGLCLTDALAALHHHGLVHRDIKPANIIFIGGRPKIADIGLVAASGQLSFVGTEGYVPPEGPGSPCADIYSLGKVLYEIAMGKDRLDFPAVNTRLDELPDKQLLLGLNQVFLRACENAPNGRYASAREMHNDLLRLRNGRSPASPRLRRLATISIFALLLATAGAWTWCQSQSRGTLVIETEPPGAMIILDGTMKRSPARFAGLKAGTHPARVMLEDYEPVQTQFSVEPGRELRPATVRLNRGRGSIEILSNPSGATFDLMDGETIVRSGTTPAALADIPAGDYTLVGRYAGIERFTAASVIRGEQGSAKIEFPLGKVSLVSDPPGAELQIDDRPVGNTPTNLDLPAGTHRITLRYRSWPPVTREISITENQTVVEHFDFPPGSVKITSVPSGATVVRDGVELGKTTLPLEDLEPGPVTFQLSLPGYEPITVSGEVRPGEQTFLSGSFVKRAGPQFDAPWENSLGMHFVPVGEVLMAVWPTRIRDYEVYCQFTGAGRQAADFEQDPNHPQVKVSWDDAMAFCDWLTQQERDSGHLASNQLYRLPTDLEWSLAAGLESERGATPEQRDGKIRGFPWGDQWPPPARAGNFADGSPRRSRIPTIAGYTDGHPATSPVGSFDPNKNGLHDICGNVWEWILDSYKPGSRWGVLRGGSWASASSAELRTSYRNVVDRSERDVIYGFRVVITAASSD